MAEPGDEERRLRADVIAAWDRRAATYDDAPRHGLLYADEWRAWRRLLGALLGDAAHSGIRPRRVLDVGTGTGVVALLAAELGHDVTGVDLSEAMLARARSKGAASGLAVDWRVADAEALPPDLVGYDVVIARHVLWTLLHPDRAIDAWRDAARPGGLVIVIEGLTRTGPPPVDAARRLAARLGTWLTGPGPWSDDHACSPDLRTRLPLANQRDASAVTTLLTRAGLERVAVRPTHELDRVERSHEPLLVRLGDARGRYVATARTPILTAA
jgi:ubiquinone/menaquinone biosynthesis C-methylase UbiE